jgi:hypothetical protein
MHSVFFFLKKKNILDNLLFFLESVWEHNINHIPLNFDFFYLKWIFYIVLDRFNVSISKIIFKKLNFLILIHF